MPGAKHPGTEIAGALVILLAVGAGLGAAARALPEQPKAAVIASKRFGIFIIGRWSVNYNCRRIKTPPCLMNSSPELAGASLWPALAKLSPRALLRLPTRRR